MLNKCLSIFFLFFLINVGCKKFVYILWFVRVGFFVLVINFFVCLCNFFVCVSVVVI